MRPAPNLRRFALGLLLALLTACGAQQADQTSMAVGASTDPESALLANLYAAALRAYGTPARVEVVADPPAALDSGQVSVLPGFTGAVLQTFQPGAPARSDEQTYKAMVATLPEGVSVGDYTTAAEDKPAIAVTGATAAAWGGRDLKALVRNCAQVTVGGVGSVHRPVAVGGCKLPAVREFPEDTALFDALRTGQVKAAWTTTADPAVPEDVVVLADRKPPLIQAQNVVPLYRRNELSQQQVLAINQVAGVLDTAALKQMRAQVAGGANPQTVAEAWLAENPLGR